MEPLAETLAMVKAQDARAYIARSRKSSMR
jgi:hypothetical protein